MTVHSVGNRREKCNRRIVAVEADVRDRVALAAALKSGVEQLDGLDVVVANAGICPLGDDTEPEAFADAIDVDLVGVLNTVHIALPYLTSGASIIITGSVAGLLSSASSGSGPQGFGGAGYNLAKRVLVEYTTTAAVKLAPRSIRVNAVHPTNCNTDMLQSDVIYKTFRPDLANPTVEEAEEGFRSMQAMPIPWVETIRHLLCRGVSGVRRISLCDRSSAEGRRRRQYSTRTMSNSITWLSYLNVERQDDGV